MENWVLKVVDFWLFPFNLLAFSMFLIDFTSC
jgi:hypothetical protein